MNFKKLTLGLTLLASLNVNFSVLAQRGGPRVSGPGSSPLGPNLEATAGTISGSITGAYSFNGPFIVVDGTNVFIRAAISNIFTSPITNANDDQFADEFTILSIKSGAVLTNISALNITNRGTLTNLGLAGFGSSVIVEGGAVLKTNASVGGALIIQGSGVVGINEIGAPPTVNVLSSDTLFGSDITVPGGITNSSLATNAIVITGPGSLLVTGKLAGLTMHSDGTLSNSAPASPGTSGTNFNMIRLDGEIYNITNAGNNTTVTADWNGPHWMRLQFNGTTTISFTNCPAASSTNGQIFVLELYAPTTVPTVTIQNIDPRFIDWGKVGQPVLVDGETNLVVIRYDGTNFLGRSWQDKTIGTITSPYVLQDNSMTSNHLHKGLTTFSNAPGDGSARLRLANTNGNGYLELTTPDFWRPTNVIVLGITNPQAGDFLKVLSATVSGGVATIIMTNSTVGDTNIGALLDILGTNNTPIGSIIYKGSHPQWHVLVPGPIGFQLTSGGETATPSWDIPGTSASVTNLSGAVITNQIQYGQKMIGEVSYTNIDLSLGYLWALNTNMQRNMMLALSNAFPGDFELHFNGCTNSPSNFTLTITNAPGITLNWIGSSTNGPDSFTVYSNTVVRIAGSCYTNVTTTNITLEWKTDSGWPQRIIPLIFAAGGSFSNATAGGMVYFDQMPAAYTNHVNTNFANCNFTNLASVFLPAHILTNFGDQLTFIWRGYMGAADGTNQLIAGIGNVTNCLGDTGGFTNKAGAQWEYKADIECKGPTNHYVYWEFKISKTNSLCNGFTNGSFFNTFPAGILTNGVTNFVALRSKNSYSRAISNDYFRVMYQPASFR